MHGYHTLSIFTMNLILYLKRKCYIFPGLSKFTHTSYHTPRTSRWTLLLWYCDFIYFFGISSPKTWSGLQGHEYHLITESGVLWIIPFTRGQRLNNVDPVFVCFAIFCHIDPFAAWSMARVIVCFQRSKDSCAEPGNRRWWHYIIYPWRHMMATISFPASRGGGKYFELQLHSAETAVWEILDGGNWAWW